MSQKTRLVDAIGLFCPVPARLTRFELQDMIPGEEVLVLADDPEAWIDIPALVHKLGYELLYIAEVKDHFEFRVRKS